MLDLSLYENMPGTASTAKAIDWGALLDRIDGHGGGESAVLDLLNFTENGIRVGMQNTGRQQRNRYYVRLAPVDAYGKQAKLDVHSNPEWTQQIISMYIVWTTTARASIRRVRFLYQTLTPETSPVEVRRTSAERNDVQSGVLHTAYRPRKVISVAS